jgi:hypothetical protein
VARNTANKQDKISIHTCQHSGHYTRNTKSIRPPFSNKQQEEMEVNPQPYPNHKPLPIFIHRVIDYDKMTKHLREIAEDEQYHTKSLANDVIKLNCRTPETYRKIIKHFKENNTCYHIYQLKEERAYRIVIRYLHHSTDITELRQELAELGHKARNIVNASN